MHDPNKFFWDESYLVCFCNDGISHNCLPKVEMMSLLEACRSSPVVGHHSGIHVLIKSYDVGITGLPSIMMLIISPSLVTVAKEKKDF